MNMSCQDIMNISVNPNINMAWNYGFTLWMKNVDLDQLA